MYDKNWLRSFQFDFPVILVGNISTGGTGKTPHVLAIANRLQNLYRIAILSRGYKRSTKGYIVATKKSLATDIGDEPKLIKQKIPSAEVAVCENRLEGISQLLLEEPAPEVILMDDGFQHRKVRPGYSIVLTAHNRLYIDDHILPMGSLREPKGSLRRADMIIVTKCPEDMIKREASEMRTTLKLLPWQQLFFTCYSYGELKPLFENQETLEYQNLSSCLLVSALASNNYLKDHLSREFKSVASIQYKDHHYFKDSDLKEIKAKLKPDQILLTTEKDAVKLSEMGDSIQSLGLSFFVLPVSVNFLFDGGEKFDQLIKRYVRDSRSIV